jgi:3-deoxy-D-manno-octulosonic-acid transferase
MHNRNVPVVLVNARLSKRSLRGYTRFKFFSKPLFLFFARICTQSLEDARRFKTLDVPSSRITVTGNIKFEQEDNPLPMAAIENLRQHLQIQPSQKILLAGSTHKGEEEILVEAFGKMKREFDDLLLIVAPRDPERAGTVQRIFQSAGLAAVSMKSLDQIDTANGYDVIVVDTIGVLKSLYAVADVAFIGGSLVSCGGHNPLEAAMFSKPILFGYDMSDFAEIADMLVAESGAVRVRDAERLYQAASKLLKDDQKANEMGQKALQVFTDNKGVVDRTLKVIEQILNEQNY